MADRRLEFNFHPPHSPKYQQGNGVFSAVRGEMV
jgi:hypothetical protein